MFYVYILKSIKDGWCYYGSTDNLKRRYKEHKEGKVYSTKFRRPLKLIYYEAFLAEKDARLRESSLKNHGKLTTELKKRLKYSLGQGAG